jgi:hypothetical protein
MDSYSHHTKDTSKGEHGVQYPQVALLTQVIMQIAKHHSFTNTKQKILFSTKYIGLGPSFTATRMRGLTKHTLFSVQTYPENCKICCFKTVACTEQKGTAT